MRIRIEIDDELMREAMEATGQKTVQATVEVALRRVVEMDRWVKALRQQSRASLRPKQRGKPPA